MAYLGPVYEAPRFESSRFVLDGYSGGTDGRVVRFDTGTSFVDADNTDNPALLLTVMFKQDGYLLMPGSVVDGLSGLTPGAAYFLTTSGQLTSTAPTPSTTVALLRIGVALAADKLLFRPGEPIRGS